MAALAERSLVIAAHAHEVGPRVEIMTQRIRRGDDIAVPSHATIVGLIADVAARSPQQVSLLDSVSGRSFSYGALMQKVERWPQRCGCAARVVAPASPSTQGIRRIGSLRRSASWPREVQ